MVKRSRLSLQVLINIIANSPPAILIVLGVLVAAYGMINGNQGLIDLGYTCLGWGILFQFLWWLWRSGMLKKVSRMR